MAIIARMMALVKPARSPNLPVPKVKRGIVGMPSRVSVGESRKQERARVRAHMQTIRDKSDGAE